MIWILKITFAFFLVPACWADSIWETPNVWDQTKNISNSIEGTVRSIDVLNQDLFVQLSIKTKRKKTEQTERLKICTSHTGGDIHNLAEAQLVLTLRQAAERSQRVRVTYEGAFNRCITSVTRI